VLVLGARAAEDYLRADTVPVFQVEDVHVGAETAGEASRADEAAAG
jgi:hypothetical protein